MANYKQPFKERSDDNTAEEYFEKYSIEKNIRFIRYGLDQRNSGISGKDFVKITRIIRNTPDYIVINNTAAFVEVKGCKENLKIKEKDIESYDVWNKHLTLFYFFYSVMKDTFKFVSHAELKKLLPLCEMGQYPDHTQWDNKMYYKDLWSSIKNG